MLGRRDFPSRAEKKVIAESVKARKRGRCRSPALSRLYDNLWRMAMPCGTRRPAKWEILQQAKIFLQQQETHLSRLLFLKANCGPYNLDEVKEEYRMQHYCSSGMVESFDSSKDETGDDLDMSQSCRDATAMEFKGTGNINEEGMTVFTEEAIEILNHDDEEVVDGPGRSQSSKNSIASIIAFEGYLFFYKQMMDMLLWNGVLLPEQSGLQCLVSKVIFSLWQRMTPEHFAVLLTFSQQKGLYPLASMHQDICLPSSSQISRQEVLETSESTMYEDMLQDVYEVLERHQDSILEDRDKAICITGKFWASTYEVWESSRHLPTKSYSQIFNPSEIETRSPAVTQRATVISLCITTCLSGISTWKSNHQLQFSLSKTEILFTSQLVHPPVENWLISPTTLAKSLKVMINSSLSFSQFMKATTWSCKYVLRNICRIFPCSTNFM
ncbi:uncharacterized protein LOC108936448 isoform X2 [Scleropages formosus]|uniref:uncharacterized protein LOC108936448 isoform X2 n=1 Tax=Scleropages formosus TaxID=113540 RepID=UPI0008790AEA|nr:uncharacterized protein LOC108936448 isoform X2 [Scleropages formosus]